MENPWQPGFLFAVCQHGAEHALKRELAVRAPEIRPAFSRPGFVTFKLDQPPARPERFQLPSVFARTWGFSLGAVKGDHLRTLAEQVWQLPEVAAALGSLDVAGLHVWQRDARPPGDRGFEPGPTPLAEEAEQAALRELAPLEVLHESGVTVRKRWIVDVALVEPGEWWAGCHLAASRTALWPGGAPSIKMPEDAASRAYLKMAEALAWSSLPMSRGERIVELGCAPGGASQALLDAGLIVVGVDPAVVDEAVLAHPRFNHVRARSVETPRKLFRGVRWLAADMNVAPAYTLDAVEALVRHPNVSIRGMLLTLKLPDWELAEELPKYVERVRGWGYRDVRLRQLAFNRQEICLAALRSRSQRRVLRTAGRHPQRRDAGQASMPDVGGDGPQI